MQDIKKDIPSFYEFFNPVLEILKNQAEIMHRSDIRAAVVDLVVKQKKLPDEIKNVLNYNKHNPEGYSIMTNNAGWAVSYLNIAGYISNDKKRGYYEITPLGLENFPCDARKISKEVNKSREKETEDGDKTEEVTTLEQAKPIEYEKNEDTWKDYVLRELKNLSPTGFENFCGHFLRHMEFDNVKITQRTRDGGFDASAILRTGLIPTRVLIECKRYDGDVAVSVVRQLRGVMAEKQVTKGIIFTTGDYTKDAYQSVADRDDITLLCGDDICNLMKKHKFGVETKMVEEIVVKYEFLSKF